MIHNCLIAAERTANYFIEQHAVNPYTPQIPWRFICRAVNTADGWKLDFISWSFIPENEYVEKLNKALE
ncbi:MAG: hypothetical protein K0M40_05305 [Prolixibacteraceae bacterium]|nr:hypothetical protein [Prolixibacteraceae bacterium]